MLFSLDVEPAAEAPATTISSIAFAMLIIQFRYKPKAQMIALGRIADHPRQSKERGLSVDHSTIYR